MKKAVSSENVKTSPSKEIFKDLTQVDLLHNVFYSITDALFILDASIPPRILECNEAASVIFGYERAELIGKTTAFLHVSDEALKEFQSVLYPAMEKDNIYFHGEYRMRRKDGSIFSSEHSIVQLLTDEGKRIGWISLVRDITERKHVEEALRESEEKYRSIVELAPDAIVTSDLKGMITSLNTAGTRISGYSKDEVVGKHFSKIGFIRPSNLPKYLKMFNSLVRGKVPEPFEAIFYHKDGTPRSVEVHVGLLKNNGKTTGFMATMRDITERKKAEERIAYLASVVDNAKVPIATVDMNGIVTYCNKAVEEMSGWTYEEAIGKPMARLCPNAGKQIEETMKEGFCLDRELKYVKKDGSSLTCSTSTFLIKDKEGNPIGIGGVALDITEREEAERALRESEEKLRGIYSAMLDGVSLVGLDGRILDCNDAVLRLHGLSREEYVGANVYSFIAPEDRQRAMQEGSEVLEKGFLLTEAKALRKIGGTFDAEINVSLLRDVSGKPSAFLGVTRDVTERKMMEGKLRQYSEHLEELVQERTKELSQSERRYSVLVEQASDGVIIAQDGKIVFTNPKFAEIIGCSRDEAVGLPFEELVAERYRQHAKERYMRVLRGETVPTLFEAEAITKTGEHVPVEVSSKLVHFQGRPADLVILRDIKERKRMEEERLKLEKLATMGQMATMVAHDLRNPLTSIRNASFYIKKNCKGRVDPECKTALEMLDTIEKETILASKVIDDLLDFASERPLKTKRHNINKIIEDSLASSIIPKNTEVERNFIEKVIAHVDEKQLLRVFLNIIKNAVQAMPNGGKLTVTTSEKRDHIEIAFADTGIGISEENMRRIFQPLFTTKAKGIGMGLAICKKIVEQHGGTISFKSKTGEGTTFIIRLPKKEEEDGQ